MASFQKRGSTWQYTVSAKPKPIRKGGFKTKKEAQIAAAEVETNLQKGIVPHLQLEPFDQYFESWLKLYKKDVAKNTYERYLNTLETIKNHFGGIPIQNINKSAYQAFLNKYGENHAKASTRKLNTHIRACIQNAIEEGIIRTDFTSKAILSGNVKAKRPEEKHLNYFESKRLLKELYKNLDKGIGHYLLLLGLTSGMRFAEIVGLTRDDFQFKTNEIWINKTWGYTKKMHEGFGPTKNEQSIRKIKMDKQTMNAFKKLFDSTPKNIHDLVFFSAKSKYKVISNGYANKLLEKVLKELNIDPISVHGLRHTHASVLLYKKVSIYYVSERLGHSDIDTTMSYYSHVIKELRERDEKSTIETFENMAV
ncbi:tyrosine-type recombinase/integrase [Schinkia azotoformans]|uniref:tyrosine-type recombinase/integrase n=1 Tax=Schinkia azotoformans TaxID=1454 RepID=UPI002DC032DC|nr:tyrosine-type recombinase/integrase [Schinkia azotoformans]MEC1714993.1 tyrosine-type recombinase/integrase [Schinkia azotoformans]MEC1740227.1 tyrosine-type recombinase/integrase [Schinkia azotoformans]MEC1747136.1 tyrosine-type recombinase/integrase [Schinkia azotoformans]MEC1766114.1 tyrosine-type recombinase/integrase [Schinkia azotoformans]MEC1785324.1 tyrosine-type recombinase/integrase [Schinkia azotoformans]